MQKGPARGMEMFKTPRTQRVHLKRSPRMCVHATRRLLLVPSVSESCFTYDTRFSATKLICRSKDYDPLTVCIMTSRRAYTPPRRASPPLYTHPRSRPPAAARVQLICTVAAAGGQRNFRRVQRPWRRVGGGPFCLAAPVARQPNSHVHTGRARRKNDGTSRAPPRARVGRRGGTV